MKRAIRIGIDLLPWLALAALLACSALYRGFVI
jgi:hypothetical protein